jgi:aspartyl-tRNA(Asn)/glutamyl-tRNA(Gln) amidotransferase subunit C
MDAMELRKTAELVRLKLTEDEIPRLEKEVTQILEYFTKMDEFKTDDLSPTAYVLSGSVPLREDTVRTEDLSSRLLENAPERDGRFFTIPKVI